MEKTFAIANKQREIFDSFYERDTGIAAMLNEYEAQPKTNRSFKVNDYRSSARLAYALRYQYQEINYCGRPCARPYNAVRTTKVLTPDGLVSIYTT